MGKEEQFGRFGCWLEREDKGHKHSKWEGCPVYWKAWEYLKQWRDQIVGM